jgi:hypothetical protein
MSLYPAFLAYLRGKKTRDGVAFQGNRALCHTSNIGIAKAVCSSELPNFTNAKKPT